MARKRSRETDANIDGASDEETFGAARLPSGKRKAAPKKTSAPRKTAGRKRAAQAAKMTPPTDDEIRIRAYFIAERRMSLGLPGDPSNDWLEAQRQLIDEAEARFREEG